MNKYKQEPQICEKCGKSDWCRWIVIGHGWLCYECKCKVEKYKNYKHNKGKNKK